jgi:hypothetical protein
MDASSLAELTPLLVQGAVGFVGVLITLFGARWYKPTVVLSSAAAGAVGGMLVCSALIDAGIAIPPIAAVVVAFVGAVATSIVAALLHRLALVAVGSVTGALFFASVAALINPAMWWLPLLGAALGALVFPFLFPLLLRLFTPAVGAACIAWAIGREDSLPIIGGIWLFGAVFQLAFGGKKKAKKKKADKG